MHMHVRTLGVFFLGEDGGEGGEEIDDEEGGGFGVVVEFVDGLLQEEVVESHGLVLGGVAPLER